MKCVVSLLDLFIYTDTDPDWNDISKAELNPAPGLTSES